MNRPSLSQKPVPAAKVGHNWKLIRNLFIIAGLLVAISIAWDLRHEARAKRERENRRILARQAEAREKAMAEAREKAEAEIRRREAELAAAANRPAPEDPPGHRPHVVTPSSTLSKPSSHDEFHTPEIVVEPELPPEIITLNAKAKELITTADSKRTEQLVANVNKLTWDLDLFLRTLPKGEQSYWQPHVERIKNAIENNRVPQRLGNVDLSKKMEELIAYALKKQKQFDRDFLDEAAKIQNAYIRKIGETAAQAESSGQKPLADLLNRTIDDTKNLDSWIQSLGVDGAR